MHLSLPCLGLTLCSALQAGCTLTSDLSRFHEAKASQDAAVDAGVSIGCGNPATLCLQLTGFDKYKGELVVVDLVSEDGKLRARALLDPATDEAKQSVVLPLAIPEADIPGPLEEHPLHLEVWADEDGDREYDADKDDGYVILLEANGVAEYTQNDDDRVDLSPATQAGHDFEMKLSKFGLHAKRLFGAMVIDTASGRSLGLVRFRPIPADGVFSVKIPSVISDKTGIDYTIEYFADVNNSGKYEGVPPDHSWVVERKSTSDGLVIARTHSAPSSGPEKDDPSYKFHPLAYQFDFER